MNETVLCGRFRESVLRIDLGISSSTESLSFPVVFLIFRGKISSSTLFADGVDELDEEGLSGDGGDGGDGGGEELLSVDGGDGGGEGLLSVVVDTFLMH